MEPSWPERIVVGVDSSPESDAALDRAVELAFRAGSTVVVVHAVGLLEEAAYKPRPDLDAIVAAAVERTGCPASLVGPPVRDDGPAVEVMLRTVERLGGDLVVVGRRGVGDAEAPLGSTSQGVLDRATVPVLVVGARAGG